MSVQNKDKKPGQSLLDYVMVISIVILALLVMGYYIRNSLSSKFRQVGDTFGGGEVYEPQP